MRLDEEISESIEASIRAVSEKYLHSVSEKRRAVESSESKHFTVPENAQSTEESALVSRLSSNSAPLMIAISAFVALRRAINKNMPEKNGKTTEIASLESLYSGNSLSFDERSAQASDHK